MPEPAPAQRARIVMAFDFGLRRIGVAVGDTISRSAKPQRPLFCAASGPDWDALTRAVRGVILRGDAIRRSAVAAGALAATRINLIGTGLSLIGLQATIGGLVALELGRVPLPGAEVESHGLRLRAEGGPDPRGRVRISTVLVTRVHADGEGADSD